MPDATGFTVEEVTRRPKGGQRRRPAPMTVPSAGDDPRPVVRIAAGRLDQLATEAEEALLASGAAVFRRGTMLVRPVSMEVPASRGRMTVAAGLAELTQPAAVDLLSQVARWERFDKRSEDWRPADPPAMVAAILLARSGRWRLPPIAGVTTTPTLRPDGSVLSAPGYDPATRLYHVPDAELRLRIPEKAPTKADAEAALATLEQLLADFPFADDAGGGADAARADEAVNLAVALSGLITPAVRGCMSVAQLHAIRANAPGSGKSFLVDLVSAISAGRPCPAASATGGSEEVEKKLVGLLLSAFPIVNLDNINGELGGDLLCQAVERPLIRVRPLGRSEIVEIESRACVFATGNALRARGDLVRRSLVCSLDAAMERPELRRFGRDPVAEVLADRGRYVGAALTVVRAYIAAGRPGVLSPLASFEDWSGTVRSALVWLGKADPCKSIETAREDDPELGDLREVMTLWAEAFGQDRRTARDAAEAAGAKKPTQIGEPTDLACPELRDVLVRIAGDRGVISTKKLSGWLLRHEGRIVGTRRFKRDGTAHGGSVLWTLRSA